MSCSVYPPIIRPLNIHYMDYVVKPQNENVMKKIIWTMWWQGEEAAPAIVKACISSMRRYANGAEVIVIDQKNYSEYFTFPPYILHSLEKETISLTHCSDITRITLLSKYGGLWLDSTILVTSDIPGYVFEREIYTIHCDTPFNNISEGRWCCFLMGGKDAGFFACVQDLLYRYLQKEPTFITYFLTDYLTNYVYSNNPVYRDILNAQSEKSMDIFALFQKLNCTYQDDLSTQLFNKISYKGDFSLYDKEGNPTYYCAILNQYHITDTSASEQRDTKFIYRHISGKISRLISNMKMDFAPYRISRFGWKLCALSAFFRYRKYIPGKMQTKICDAYHKCINNCLAKIWEK